jgi:hypothetical protein
MTSRKVRLAEPFAFAGVLLVASSAAPAFAYIDPGTGSMMLQLLLGGVAGAMVVGRLYMRRISDRFRVLVGRKPASGESAAQPDPR